MTLHELKQNLHSNRHTLIPYGIPVIVYSLAYFLIIAPFLNRSSEIDFIEADRIRSVEKYRTVLKHEKYYRKDIERS
ncbi:MAG: hypothetical protein JNL74_14810, partial [Fibrobacteres bacterium]|nr:hypothetical protein [Fibrobacterota bacterium]